MATYGTVMIGKLAPGVTRADWEKGLEEWKQARNAPGFQGEYLLVGDDGRTIASCVIFSSKEEYLALADDPEQDTWWREKAMPMLDGDVQWIDGSWG